MHLPLNFAGYGIIEGKMYKHYRNQGVFVMPPDVNRTWGNDVVYGAFFHVSDFEFYIRIIDAYHLCSMSTLYRNHTNDLHHRVNVKATPIYFSTLDELARLKYREGEPIEVQTYFGNPNHPKINQRINKTVSYRVIDGIDAENFKQLFREGKV